jgi:hypothetical protein
MDSGPVDRASKLVGSVRDLDKIDDLVFVLDHEAKYLETKLIPVSAWHDGQR